MRPILIASAVLSAAQVCAGQGYIETAKLLAPTPVDGARFGWDVALSGDTLAVSALEEHGPQGTGFVHVFTRTGTRWAETAVLQPQAPGSWVFGWSVELSGDRLVASDPSYAGRGRVVVFRRNGSTWTEEASFAASDTQSGDDFGSSLDLDGDRLAVGAYQNHRPGLPGTAYLFVWDGTSWVQEARLDGSGATPDAHFGTSIALEGDRVVVGAPHHAAQLGGLWIFRRQAGVWGEEIAFPGMSTALGTQFAAAVDLQMPIVMVGAPLDDWPLGVGDSGVLYQIAWDGAQWSPNAIIAWSGAPAGTNVGTDVVLNGTELIAGAWGDRVPSPNTHGSVPVWKPLGGFWVSDQRLLPLDLDATNRLGNAVAADGTTIVAGAWMDSQPAHWAGSVHVFGRRDAVGTALCVGAAAECPCGNAGYGSAGCGNSSAPNGATLLAFGSASVSQDSLVLRASGMPPRATSLLAQGPTGAARVPWGDGLRCLPGTGIVRLGQRASVAGARLDPELGATPLSVRGSIPGIGATVVYQVLYRDVGAAWCTPDLFNATNALEVVWGP